MSDKILVLEDDFSVARLLVLFLSGQGYEVCDFGLAGLVLEFLAHNQVDLIIFTFEVSDIKSTHFLEQLEIAKLSVPVIGLTDGMSNFTANQLVKEVVCKPFSPAHLAQLITHILHPDITLS